MRVTLTAAELPGQCLTTRRERVLSSASTWPSPGEALREALAAWSGLRGRADEVETLVAQLERGAAHGAALAMAGRTGVGKTALLSATLTAGQATGWTVLSASGVEFESAIGYSTLNQLLLTVHDHIARLPAAPSELLSVALGLASGRAPSRSAVTDAMLTLFGELAASAPLLIAVDDLQWVDRPSAEVIAAVARQVPRRVTVLAAYRSDTTAAVNVAGIAHHTIAPLEADAAEQLLAHVHPDLGPRARHSILDQAEGIPLLLVELPNALDERQRDLDRTPRSCRWATDSTTCSPSACERTLRPCGACSCWQRSTGAVTSPSWLARCVRTRPHRAR